MSIYGNSIQLLTLYHNSMLCYIFASIEYCYKCFALPIETKMFCVNKAQEKNIVVVYRNFQDEKTIAKMAAQITQQK